MMCMHECNWHAYQQHMFITRPIGTPVYVRWLDCRFSEFVMECDSLIVYSFSWLMLADQHTALTCLLDLGPDHHLLPCHPFPNAPEMWWAHFPGILHTVRWVFRDLECVWYQMCWKLEDLTHIRPAWLDHIAITEPNHLYMYVTQILHMFVAWPIAHVSQFFFAPFWTLPPGFHECISKVSIMLQGEYNTI